MPRHIACLTFDFDAMSGFISRGMTSPSPISRGEFGANVGAPRILDLLKKYDVPSSWYIPGHTLETYLDQCKRVSDAGHEIGIHGYSHENPIAMTREQETEILDKCIELVTRLSGKRPTGYVAPWWEFSPVTNELLLERA